MAYDPVDPRDRNPPVAANAGIWQQLIDNDAAVFEHYCPGYEANPHGASYAAAQQFNLRWRRGKDEPGIVVGLRASASSGSKTFTAATSGVTSNDSDTMSVSTDGWYGVTLTPTGYSSDYVNVRISTPDPSPQTVSVTAVRLSIASAAPSSGLIYYGYRKIGTRWYGSGAAINTDVLTRLRTNPVELAVERPVCVFAHVAESLRSVTGKSPDLWGNYDTADWARVGSGLVPRCDTGERLYRFDAYVTETGSAGTAKFSIQVGPHTEQFDDTGAPGWHTWSARLGPGPHEISANLKPGSGQGAAIRTLLVWRYEL